MVDSATEARASTLEVNARSPAATHRRCGQVSCRVIHHGPAAGSKLALSVTMVETAFWAALVALSRTVFAELSSALATGGAAVNLTPLTPTTHLEQSLASWAPPLTKQLGFRHPPTPRTSKTWPSKHQRVTMRRASADGPGLPPRAVITSVRSRRLTLPGCFSPESGSAPNRRHICTDLVGLRQARADRCRRAGTSEHQRVVFGVYR